MPYINIKMYPGRPESLKREIAEKVQATVLELCGFTDPAICPVVIEEVAREDWDAQVVPEIEARAANRLA